MCVIITKPQGVRMPSEEIINMCASANSHGFGFVSTRHEVYKSMNLEKFKKELEKVSRDEACIMHFRIATHGSIRKDNCHPFQIGDLCFAHNGMLSVEPIEDKTDSETVFIQTLYPAYKTFGYDSKEFKQVVGKVIEHSRFAFLDKSVNKLSVYGEGWVNIGGCYFSNKNFLWYGGYYSVNDYNYCKKHGYATIPRARGYSIPAKV